jgi:hypothetical protein
MVPKDEINRRYTYSNLGWYRICIPIAAGGGIDKKYAVASIVTGRRVSVNISERIFAVTTLAEWENADKNKIPRETMGVEKPR